MSVEDPPEAKIFLGSFPTFRGKWPVKRAPGGPAASIGGGLGSQLEIFFFNGVIGSWGSILGKSKIFSFFQKISLYFFDEKCKKYSGH